jgi:hypothetical protein
VISFEIIFWAQISVWFVLLCATTHGASEDGAKSSIMVTCCRGTCVSPPQLSVVFVFISEKNTGKNAQNHPSIVTS